MTSGDTVKDEFDRKKTLEAQIAALKNEIDEKSSRISASDVGSVGSMSTDAKRIVVRRVARKVRRERPCTQQQPLAPVDETSCAAHDAMSAEQRRLRLEMEIASMEASIAAQRQNLLQKLSIKGSNMQVNEGSSPGSFQEVVTGELKIQQQEVPLQGERPKFLHSIAMAASDREERIERGAPNERCHLPETDAPLSYTQQSSFDLAEMVCKVARDRELRLGGGGESKMRAVETRGNIRDDFKSIVSEAAQLGRLTRLREHVVEATAADKTPEQVWRSQGLLAIQWRSNHMSVIHEAALAGAASKLPEKVVSSFPDEQSDAEYESQLQSKAMSPRMRQLVELNQRVGAGQHKVDKLVMGRKEERGVDSLIVKPMWCYANVNDVILPKAPPKFNVEQRRREMAKRPMIDISNEAATKAWERRARLDRPNVLPKIKEQCSCSWCGTASPFQTYAYKVKETEKKCQESLASAVKKNDLDQQDVDMMSADSGFLDASSDDHSVAISVLSSESRRSVRKVRKVRRVRKCDATTSGPSNFKPDLEESAPENEGHQDQQPVAQCVRSDSPDTVSASPPEAAPTAPTSTSVGTSCACVIL
jgi:hypothetical protein